MLDTVRDAFEMLKEEQGKNPVSVMLKSTV